MSDRQPTSRRSGGRAARIAARAAAPTERAAGPGVEGGRYRPLAEREVEAIHRAAIEVLATIGMGEVPAGLRDRALAHGCSEDGDGRVLFPRALVEDIIANAARSFVLHARDSKADIEVSARRVHFGTGGAAVRTLDLDSGDYRPSTLVDLYDFARLVDRLDNLSWFTRCVVATDMDNDLDLDINTVYAIAAGTSKHVGTSFARGEHVAPAVALFDTILGGEGRFRERPFCKVHISPVVSPLRYGEDAVSVAEAAIACGMPINAIIGAQAGATAPAPLASVLVHTVAETLAALVMVNLIAPGYPMVVSNWPFVSDLRTGSFSGGGAEIAVLNAAAAQLINHYELPSGVAASMADAKIPDAQAGYEKGITALAAGLAGANMIYESAGMYASLLGASFEGFVIDDEMLGSVLRAVRGIEVTDETLDIAVINEVVHGPGHFLGHAQTLKVMETEYLYPQLADRSTPDEWAANGARSMRERARAVARDILDHHHPQTISARADRAIRERFRILLPRERTRGRR